MSAEETVDRVEHFLDDHPLVEAGLFVGFTIIFGPILFRSAIGRFGVDTRLLAFSLIGCVGWGVLIWTVTGGVFA